MMNRHRQRRRTAKFRMATTEVGVQNNLGVPLRNRRRSVCVQAESTRSGNFGRSGPLNGWRFYGMDDCGLLEFGGEAEVKSDEVATFFTVAKDAESDRTIVNRDARNQVEIAEGRVQDTFPHGCSLCDVKLEENEALRISADDLENFYHQRRVSRKHALSNAVGPLVDAKAVEATAAWRRFTKAAPLGPCRGPLRARVVGAQLAGTIQPTTGIPI